MIAGGRAGGGGGGDLRRVHDATDFDDDPVGFGQRIGVRARVRIAEDDGRAVALEADRRDERIVEAALCERSDYLSVCPADLQAGSGELWGELRRPRFAEDHLRGGIDVHDGDVNRDGRLRVVGRRRARRGSEGPDPVVRLPGAGCAGEREEHLFEKLRRRVQRPADRTCRARDLDDP